jgi:hypothetical protein
MPQSINNDKDLKSALKAAKTAQDHERISAYYKTRAEQLDTQAAEYQQSAASLRNGPVVKNITAPNTAARYDAMAQGLHQQAQSQRDLAATQEQVARTLTIEQASSSR